MYSAPFTQSFGGFSAEKLSNFFPAGDQVNSLAHHAMETSTNSAQATFKGAQEASQLVIGHMNKQMGLCTETMQKLSSVRSLDDAISLQTQYVSSALDHALNNFSALSELYTDTLREAFAPVSRQARKAARQARTA